MPTRMLRDWTGSESVNLLSEGAEVFFGRLIMKADDFGCYYGNPKILSSTLYPLKKIAMERVVKLRDECANAGIIQVYKVDGKEFVHIPNFGQRLRAMNRKFPEPPEAPKITVLTDDGHMTAESVRHVTAEVKRRETEEEVEVEEKGRALPPFEGELLNKWIEWEKHRKEKHAALTPTARQRQIKMLGARPPNEAIAMINYSLDNGYTGLFEPKGNGIRNTNQKSVRGADAIVKPGKDFGSFG